MRVSGWTATRIICRRAQLTFLDGYVLILWKTSSSSSSSSSSFCLIIYFLKKKNSHRPDNASSNVAKQWTCFVCAAPRTFSSQRKSAIRQSRSHLQRCVEMARNIFSIFCAILILFSHRRASTRWRLWSPRTRKPCERCLTLTSSGIQKQYLCCLFCLFCLYITG